MEKKNKLLTYLNGAGHKELFNNAFNLIRDNPDKLDYSNSGIRNPDGVNLESLQVYQIVDVRISDLGVCEIACFAECNLQVFGKHLRGYDACDDVCQCLKFLVTLSFSDHLELSVLDVRSFFQRREIKLENGLKATSDLVPLFKKASLDERAEKILMEYYPEALKEPMAVPIESIVTEKLGLNIVKDYRISADRSVLGEIVLSETDVKVYPLFGTEFKTISTAPGSIFVDKCAIISRNAGCVNNTIAHEMVHWLYHRPSVAVKCLNDGETSIACRCTKMDYTVRANTKWNPVQWMEWQATQLAPRILMPRSMFLIKAREVMERHGYFDEDDGSYVLAFVIEELADFFKVSKLSAQIRMEELGIIEKNTHVVEAKQRYTIDPIDDKNEQILNASFKRVLESGLFIKVDNMYIIDDPTYIKRNNFNLPELTDYAKSHLEECALLFDERVVFNPEYESVTGIINRRDGSTYRIVATFMDENNVVVTERAEMLKAIKEDIALNNELENKKSRYDTFAERVKLISDIKGIDRDEFEFLTDLDHNFCYRVFENKLKGKPDIHNVFSVCAGLDLSPDQSREIFELAGHCLRINDPTEAAYKAVIDNMRYFPKEAKNEFLREMHIRPIGMNMSQ